jgi:hypothetical protein
MFHNEKVVTSTSEIIRIRISQLPIPLQQAVSVIELGCGDKYIQLIRSGTI